MTRATTSQTEMGKIPILNRWPKFWSGFERLETRLRLAVTKSLENRKLS